MEKEKITQLEDTIRRDYSNIAGIVVRKDGETVWERYFGGCSEASRLHVFSVTKSVVSVLVGIAIDRGHIRSVDQKVADFFPEAAARNGSLREVTLENLLTMTVPYKYRLAPYKQYFTSDDWVEFSLGLVGEGRKVGRFRYAPLIGPDILSGILVRATGRRVLEFAKENLFAPLGIEVEKSIVFGSKEEQMAFNRATNISGWAADPQGMNAAAWGLTLSAADMAKLGQLLLNGGMWNGARIVSEGWVARSTSEHARWKQRDLAYGYLWWAGVGGGRAYAAMGDGGNAIYVDPARGMVVAIASIFAPRAKDRIEFIKEQVEPLWGNDPA
ncbi:serine hydrolase domain-containing protein [Allofournierella sp.]|uniref:serine hydrolase domain-containing protein n=1 Tax=Allofournierella sp. TaxID=1940256 RepID=UPI003AB32032